MSWYPSFLQKFITVIFGLFLLKLFWFLAYFYVVAEISDFGSIETSLAAQRQFRWLLIKQRQDVYIHRWLFECMCSGCAQGAARTNIFVLGTQRARAHWQWLFHKWIVRWWGHKEVLESVVRKAQVKDFVLKVRELLILEDTMFNVFINLRHSWIRNVTLKYFFQLLIKNTSKWFLEKMNFSVTLLEINFHNKSSNSFLKIS